MIKKIVSDKTDSHCKVQFIKIDYKIIKIPD